MQITVTRFTSDSDATLSLIRVDGKFICFGLEDEYREHKLANETRIPAGTYKLGVRTVGGFNDRYSRKFPDMHKGMLHVLDVPGFTYILIHVGNTAGDTAGCLLVGTGAWSAEGNMSLQASVVAYQRLYPIVIEEALKGNATITFEDADLAPTCEVDDGPFVDADRA